MYIVGIEQDYKIHLFIDQSKTHNGHLTEFNYDIKDENNQINI